MMTTDIKAPRGGTFPEREWQALSRFWHPVAACSEVADGPVSATLLDVPLVLYRAKSVVNVALDICPHRGSRLSDGTLIDEHLVCPYHGLHFNGEGRCTLIPAQGPDKPISERLRLKSFPAVERHGLIWTTFCPDPIVPAPNWPTLDREDVRQSPVPPETWDVAAARHAENFNDIAHVAWVHPSTFGTLPPGVPDYDLERTPVGLRHSYREMGNNRLFERHMTPAEAGDETVPIPDVLFSYDFTFPFASSLEVRDPKGRSSFIFDVIQPLSRTRSRIYKIIARNFDLDGPIDRAVAFEQAVNREDRAVLEPAFVDAMPLDPTAEFHIRADRWSIAYRRALQEFESGRFGDLVLDQ